MVGRIKTKKKLFKISQNRGGVRKTVDKGQFKGAVETDSFCGCCTMFDTKIFKKIKKLDEDFFSVQKIWKPHQD